jgi:hypothetical protein
MKILFANKILTGIKLLQKMQQLPVFRTSLLNATKCLVQFNEA